MMKNYVDDRHLWYRNVLDHLILQDKIEVAFSNVDVIGNSFESYDKLL